MKSKHLEVSAPLSIELRSCSKCHCYQLDAGVMSGRVYLPLKKFSQVVTDIYGKNSLVSHRPQVKKVAVPAPGKGFTIVSGVRKVDWAR